MNELIFLAYVAIVTSSSLLALRAGKEALVALVSVQWVLANLFVTKQIMLFGLNATASDALAVGASLGLNLIQEYFGRQLAKKTIFIAFGVTLFYTTLSWLQVLYCPSSLDKTHEHFCALLNPMPRIIIASMAVYLLVQLLDYALYGFLKKNGSRIPQLVRNYISVGTTQCVDTVLFSFLGLYGIVNNIGEIIIISYSVKLLILLLAAPFLALSRYTHKAHV